MTDITHFSKFGHTFFFSKDLANDFISDIIDEKKTFYEDELLTWLTTINLMPGAIIDCGANIGNHSVYFSKVLNRDVVAFEPNAIAYKILVKNIALNNLQNISAYELALGSEAGFGVSIQNTTNNLGASKILLDNTGDINIVALDSATTDIDKISMLKIDVEGFELNVLRGARKIIATQKPLILIEIFNYDAYINIINELGLEYKPIIGFGATPLVVLCHKDNIDDIFPSNKGVEWIRSYFNIQNKLSLANEKYRELTVSLTKNKKEIEGLQTSITQLNTRSSDQSNSISVQSNTITDIELKLSAVNEKYRELTTIFDANKIKISDLVSTIDLMEIHSNDQSDSISTANKTISSLKNELAISINKKSSLLSVNTKLNIDLSALSKDIEDLEINLSQSQDELTNKSKELYLSNTEKSELINTCNIKNKDLISLNKQVNVMTSQSAYLEEKLESSKAEIKTLSSQILNTSNELYLSNQDKVDSDNMLASKSSELDKEQLELMQLKSEFIDATAKIKSLNSKIINLSEELVLINLDKTNSENSLVCNASKLDATRAELIKLKSDFHNVSSKLKIHSVLIEKIKKENQILTRVKKSLSFQLGHALIFAFKDIKNFLGLPKLLLKIRADAIKRRSMGNFTAPVSVNTPAMDRIIGKFNNPLSSSKGLHSLKVATIMDDFTMNSFLPECHLLNLSLSSYQEELNDFQPDMVFIESAWRGADDKWGNRVSHTSDEVINIISWANHNNIPTVFWNKEDPVHFETFLTTAKLFDFVFTTDIDKISSYKQKLNHDNVFLMPFACQPATTNPIEKFKRKDAFCFAGAYYAKYPERTLDLEGFISELPKLKNFEIYDRNYNNTDENYKFPKEYDKFIIGTLPFNEIDKAYKGYRYAINLNSIKQSQTMFARRVFELMASNTIVLSNFSKGVRLFFGDLVVSTDNKLEASSKMSNVMSQNILEDKIKTNSLRKVLGQHTYEDRFSYICSKIWLNIETAVKPVLVIHVASTKDDVNKCVKMFTNQSLENKHLIVIAEFDISISQDGITVVSRNDFEKQFAILNPDLFAVFSKSHFYGDNYLLDLFLATKYTSAKCITKTEFFEFKDNTAILKNKRKSYRWQEMASVNSSMFTKHALSIVSINEIIYPSDEFITGMSILSIDRFNFCHNGANAPAEVLDVVNDDLNIDTGIDIDQLRCVAENIPAALDLSSSIKSLDLYSIINEIDFSGSDKVNVINDESNCLFSSSLNDGKHEYFYSKKFYDKSLFNMTDTGSLFLDIDPGLNIQLVIFFMNHEKTKISHLILPPNKNNSFQIPAKTEFIKFGLRIFAKGKARINNIFIEKTPPQPKLVNSCNNVLLLTNNYPSYDDLYKNAFIHSRVLSYKNNNINADVCCLTDNNEIIFNEFQGVDVVRANTDNVFKMISENNYSTILVHFLDKNKWATIKPFIEDKKIIIWAHGADIQPFHRREFMFDNEQDKATARHNSKNRVSMWKSVFNLNHPNIHFVFVSQWFANTVFEDYNISLRSDQYSIIHNYVSSDMFDYQTKKASDRLNILSIRPYASSIYANDLSVRAVLELSKKPFFNELNFTFYGEGILFDEITKPISNMSNVTVVNRFLTHSEISTEHKKNGIFLVPTRMDTQGVSRDEAMSSGLVPITTNIAAIPEFTDNNSAMVVGAEDYVALANSIEELYHNQDLFLKLSSGATLRASRQSSFQNTILKEITLIDPSNKKNNYA